MNQIRIYVALILNQTNYPNPKKNRSNAMQLLWNLSRILSRIIIWTLDSTCHNKLILAFGSYF